MSAAEPAPAVGRYRTAASALLRDTTLDALGDLLRESNWRHVTMNDVASAAGLSRQSLYKEFGSRGGLAKAYASRLTDLFVDAVETALYANENDANTALRQSFSAFLAMSGQDPLVRSLHTDEAPDDLLRLITTDSAFLVDRAGDRLSDVFQRGWIGATSASGRVLSTAVVRMALSYIAQPPNDDAAAADDLAALLTPFIEAIRAT